MANASLEATARKSQVHSSTGKLKYDTLVEPVGII